MSFNAQQKYWDSVASQKEFSTPLNCELFRKFVPADATIVDLGCGYGRTICDLIAMGYDSRRVSGFDISQAMIDRGKRERPELDINLMQPGKIPLADASVDAVTLMAVLTCIVGDEAQREIMAEIKRVLRPDGICCISDFPIQPFERCTQRYEKYASKYGCYGVFELPSGGVLRHMSIEFLHELTAGFETLDERKIQIRSMNDNEIIAWQYFGRKQ